MTTAFHELDTVVLVRDLPASGLRSGDLGAVVHTYGTEAVEVEFVSTQQTLRWDSIRPQILVGSRSYEMRPTPLMNNRWEGQISVPPSSESVSYHYRLDYDYNSFGKPKADNVLSPEYTLRIRPESPK